MPHPSNSPLTDSLDDAMATMERAAAMARATVDELRSRLVALEAERDRLFSALVPLPEAEARLERWIAEQVARVEERYGMVLATSFGAPPRGIDPDTERRLGVTLPILSHFERWTSRGEHNELRDLIGLFPDLVRESWRRALDAGYAQSSVIVGLPAAERAERFRVLAAEIATLERAEEEVIVAARRRGMRLARREPVQAALLAKAKTLRAGIEAATAALRDLELSAHARGPVEFTEHQARIRAQRDDVARRRTELADLEAIL